MAPLRSALASTLAVCSALLASAAPTATSDSDSDSAAAVTASASAVRQLYSFTPPLFLENLRVRPNGRLVVGSVARPYVYDFDPGRPSAAPRVLASINETTPSGAVGGITGIAAFSASSDMYAVLGGVINVTAPSVGSPGLYVFDAAAAARGPSPGSSSSSGPVVMRKAADLDGVLLPNGLTPLPGADGVFLLADSLGGAVYRADSRTGRVGLAVKDPEMGLPPGGSPGPRIPLGVNGVGVRDGHLYWTNTARGSFSRLRINADGTRAPGATAEVLARVPAGFAPTAGFDDFALDSRGVAYVAVNPSGVVRVDTRTTPAAVSVVARNDPALRDPTAVRFARNADLVLYGTTNSGQIFEIDLPRTD